MLIKPPVPCAEAAGPSGSTHPCSSSEQGQRGPDDERIAGSDSEEIMERDVDSNDEEDVDQEEIGEAATFTYQQTLGQLHMLNRGKHFRGHSCMLHRAQLQRATGLQTWVL